MKTFEEIFDSIERKRKEEERRKKEEETRIKARKELMDKIITAYQFIVDFRLKLYDTKRVNEYIENEKLMDLIFERFREQVEWGSQKLTFKHCLKNVIRFDIIKDILLTELQLQLPSYDIDISLNDRIYKMDKSQDYNIIITAEKNPLKDKTAKIIKAEEEIPYIFIEYDNEIRDLVAQFVYELLETIPQLDEEELSALKEIGVVREYQPMQLGNASANRTSKPEIISIRSFSNINNEILQEVKNLFTINDGTHLYDRKFSYYFDDDLKHVVKMRKSLRSKEI